MDYNPKLMTIKTPIILAAILVGTLSYRQVKSTGQVLGVVIVPTPTPTSTPTPLPTATPTPTSTPTPSPTPRPTLTPTPTPVPQPKFTSAQIYEFTNRFGGQYGVDPNVLRHIATCESGFRPEARNYIYAGLYQFDTRTWRVYRQKMGEDPDPDLRYNAEEAVQTAAYALSLGQLRLWPNCKP